MFKKLYYILFVVFIQFFCCSIFEPEAMTGSLQLVFISDSPHNTLSKPLEALNNVRYILQKNDEKREGYLSPQGSVFKGEISDLEPASHYSILLYGSNGDSEIIARGFKDSINVIAGDQTIVTIVWSKFRAALNFPENASIVSNTHPSFDWSDVNGTEHYQLEVDNSTGFDDPIIDQDDLTNSYYTAEVSLSDDEYYWRVRNRDSQGNWGSWSEVWQFVLQTEQPNLNVTPNELDFSSNETTLTFEISNNGTNTLTWSVDDDRSWIEVNPVSGTTTSETDQVTVTVDLSDLSAGTYSGTITITSNGGTKTVVVNTSKEMPDLSISANTLDFGSGESIKTFSIQNIGTGTLEWNATVDKDWMGLNPTNGTTTSELDQVTVTVDRNGLSEDNYSALITVNSNGGTETIVVNVSVVIPFIPEMILVEGGFFRMGDIFGVGEDDELPVHTVTLDSFLISKIEITQGLWTRIMGDNPSYFTGNENLPVERVSWFDAIQFCNTLSEENGLTPCYTINESRITWNTEAAGYRLPTEAEWEYAARGGSQSLGYRFSGSDNVDEVAWHFGNSGSATHLVAQKNPNELGIFDMSGNVVEWCWDWFDADYYSVSPSDNPTGPASGDERVIRGGSWGNYTVGTSHRSSKRNYMNPNESDIYTGFRVVRSQ